MNRSITFLRPLFAKTRRLVSLIQDHGASRGPTRLQPMAGRPTSKPTIGEALEAYINLHWKDDTTATSNRDAVADQQMLHRAVGLLDVRDDDGTLITPGGSRPVADISAVEVARIWGMR